MNFDFHSEVLGHAPAVSRRTVLAFSSAFLAASVMPAAAQDWPAKPVRIVSPFAAGGSSDTMARIVADFLSSKFGQQFFVENRGGAGGLIGTALVASAAADGYTFLISSIGTHVTSPATASNPGYDPLANFTQVAFVGGPPSVIAAHPSLGVKSFAELMALLKSGVSMPFVSPGPGTIGHLIGEYLAGKENVKLSHIAYKGSGQAINDLVAGHVKLGSMTWTAALGQMRGGTIVPLAVSSARRMPEFPDVPTLKELGYPELVVTTWFGFAAPAGLPEPITAGMNEAINEALKTPAVRDRLAAEGFEQTPMSSAEFTDFVAADIKQWAPLAKRLAGKN